MQMLIALIGVCAAAMLLWYGWIAKVTSSLHDLLPVTEKSCKTKFRISWAGNKNPEVNFTNIAET